MFDITNARGFHEKLNADFADYMQQPDSSRHALNCIITAYHLHEWVWGDLLKNDYGTWQKLGLTGRPDVDRWRSWIDRACPWFFVTQALANGTKHFIREQAIKTDHVSGYGQGPYGAGPYGTPYLLVDLGETAAEHRYKAAAQLIEVVVRFWNEFFSKFYPASQSGLANS